MGSVKRDDQSAVVRCAARERMGRGSGGPAGVPRPAANFGKRDNKFQVRRRVREEFLQLSIVRSRSPSRSRRPLRNATDRPRARRRADSDGPPGRASWPYSRVSLAATCCRVPRSKSGRRRAGRDIDGARLDLTSEAVGQRAAIGVSSSMPTISSSSVSRRPTHESVSASSAEESTLSPS